MALPDHGPENIGVVDTTGPVIVLPPFSGNLLKHLRLICVEKCVKIAVFFQGYWVHAKMVAALPYYVNALP